MRSNNYVHFHSLPNANDEVQWNEFSLESVCHPWFKFKTPSHWKSYVVVLVKNMNSWTLKWNLHVIYLKLLSCTKKLKLPIYTSINHCDRPINFSLIPRKIDFFSLTSLLIKMFIHVKMYISAMWFSLKSTWCISLSW